MQKKIEASDGGAKNNADLSNFGNSTRHLWKLGLPTLKCQKTVCMYGENTASSRLEAFVHQLKTPLMSKERKLSDTSLLSSVSSTLCELVFGVVFMA